MKRFLELLGRGRRDQPVVIVSGLPRSGTSMMMKMLEAGGLTPLTDNLRTPDIDNPRGYYEFERVKKLDKGDYAWLAEAQGKVVKVIAVLLPHLPAAYQYRVVFMQRAMPEILASQRKMLINRGENPDKISDEQLSRLFEKHLRQVNTWVESQPNVRRIDVSYNKLLEEPVSEVERLNRFLGNGLDADKMLAVIDPDLYRQRAQGLKS